MYEFASDWTLQSRCLVIGKATEDHPDMGLALTETPVIVRTNVAACYAVVPTVES
jgi:hypothetical protein